MYTIELNTRDNMEGLRIWILLELWKTSCAQIARGGWWYNSCHHSNLNGLYHGGSHSLVGDGVNWYHWRGSQYSLKYTEMKVHWLWYSWCIKIAKSGDTRGIKEFEHASSYQHGRHIGCVGWFMGPHANDQWLVARTVKVWCHVSWRFSPGTDFSAYLYLRKLNCVKL